MITDPNLAELERAMDSLAVLPPKNAVIPESVFKQVILPIISDFNPDMDTSGWLRVTGTYDRAIDVYTDDANELLFTVPPLFIATQLYVQESNQDSISKVVEDYRRLVSRMPAAADNMLKSTLGKKIQPRKLSESETKAILEIKKRYNIDLDVSEEATTDNQDIEYEDL